MKLESLTHTETLQHSLKEYNEREWIKIVNRFNSYDECKFYEWIDTPNAYKTIFAVYITDGIRFMSEVSYHSILSNTGFTRFIIDENSGEVKEIPFLKEDGKKGRLENSKDGRRYMRDITKLRNWIFTTCWVG